MTRRRVSLDAVYPLGAQPGEASLQQRNTPGKSPYLALFRMNTGYWKSEFHFKASDDAEAVITANAFIPKRKPRDVTYMVLHALYALDTPGSDTGEQP